MIEKYLNKITHGDCLDIMRELPDKCIELILTDPPMAKRCQGVERLAVRIKVLLKITGKAIGTTKFPTRFIFKRCFEFQRIKSYSAEILWLKISIKIRRVGLFGINKIQAIMPIVNWRGLLLVRQ